MKTRSLTKVTLLTLCLISLITAVTLNSCQKEVIKPKTISTGKATSKTPTVSMSILLNEINSMVFSSARSKKEKGMGVHLNIADTSGGVTISVDTITKPYSTTYNYGTGCTGADGKTRSGVAIISYDNTDLTMVNNTYTLTFQNYSITGYPITQLNGNINLTNIGTNGNGNLVITETGGYTGMDSLAATINFNYQYEWIAGSNSSPLSNLQFSVTGYTSGSFPNGITGVDSITTPLIKNCKTDGCNFYIQGTSVSIANGSTIIKSIDYSNPGGCSGQMAVTENGVTSIVKQ